jgi:hypothetical protein
MDLMTCGVLSDEECEVSKIGNQVQGGLAEFSQGEEFYLLYNSSLSYEKIECER